MGITERKEREREDLRKSILQAAMEVFLQKGYANTSIRNIAEKIEYSPTTIYLYYKDKDSIFDAIHQEGFDMLNSRMDVLRHVSDPFERLIAMGRIYMEFALEHADLYNLMFTEKAPIKALEEKDADCWEEGKNAFEMLQFTMHECVLKGYFPENDIEISAFVVWSTLHGMCSLYNAERCSKKIISDEKKDHIVQLGFETFVAMLKAMQPKK